MDDNEQTMKKRAMHKFTWVPHQDHPKHPAIPTPYRKPELRKPIYMLCLDGEELYFVNFSSEILEFVISGTGGFQTVNDDDVMTVGGSANYTYESVRTMKPSLIFLGVGRKHNEIQANNTHRITRWKIKPLHRQEPLSYFTS